MNELLTLVTIVLAVSLDSFTVGLTYGVRKMTLPWKSLLLIGVMSALTFYTSMSIGSYLSSFLEPHQAEQLGGWILMAIGMFVLLQYFRSSFSLKKEGKNVKPYILKWEIQSLGVVIQILRKPMSADFDRSGSITGFEAIFLGLALSLDAFGAGIGISMFGFPTFLTSFLVAAMSSLLLFTGMKCGRGLSYKKGSQKLSFVPGLILVIIGVFKL
ncbi:sporulation membrane protein YtaF [Bacillaceae bacterium S4-13-58]